MSEPTPPILKLTWCPVCGHNDRWTGIGRQRHYSGGTRCPGVPVTLTYPPPDLVSAP